MNTLTGRQARTITGYVATLLEYPRWCIDREVDFSTCHLQGRFESSDARCVSCEFGQACRWLHLKGHEPMPDTPLTELVDALETAVTYFRRDCRESAHHVRQCACDTCDWLREANAFLRTHRHKT
jgi:hypothetical protein